MDAQHGVFMAAEIQNLRMKVRGLWDGIESGEQGLPRRVDAVKLLRDVCEVLEVATVLLPHSQTVQESLALSSALLDLARQLRSAGRAMEVRQSSALSTTESTQSTTPETMPS